MRLAQSDGNPHRQVGLDRDRQGQRENSVKKKNRKIFGHKERALKK